MKFINIPDNGSSWGAPLIYKMESESAERVDAEVTIIDEESGDTLHRKMLYGVTEAETDIAPYLRKAMNRKPYIPQRTGFVYAEGAMTVSVDAGGEKSEPRRVFRAAYDPSRAAMMTTQPQRRIIAAGEIDTVTLYATQMLTATVETGEGEQSTTAEIYFPTDATPCDFFLRAEDLPEGTERIAVTFHGDGELLGRIEYTVVEPATAGRRVMWYNRMGGLECYTYPLCRTIEAQAQVSVTRTAEGVTARLTGGGHRVRLTSAYETRQQYDALHEAMFSPHVWILAGDEPEELPLLTRRADYPEPQQLACLELEAEQRWEGGVR
ncbi:MAG: hypothetical protein K2F95_00025 [Alistipes sp.]|nr:hypothetical protein [Alistipes sp.]